MASPPPAAAAIGVPVSQAIKAVITADGARALSISFKNASRASGRA
jgi:hypothetical protein